MVVSQIKMQVLLMALLVTPVLLRAQLTLPRLVGDSMVLQRNQKVSIWGWAGAGEKVTVVLNGKTAHAVTDSAGVWKTLLPPMKAGGPYDMRIATATESIIIHSVLIGDVWVCSGQSNMEFPLRRIMHLYPEDVKRAAKYLIREFDVTRRYSYYPVKEAEGRWKPANATNLPGFSAVAYFFAQSLYEKNKIPVGIIHSSWPGTAAECWMSEEALQAYPHYYKSLLPFKDSLYVDSLLAADNRIFKDWYRQLRNNDQGLRKNGPWQPVYFPGYWEQQGAAGLDGIVRVRKTVTVPAAFAQQEVFLELGLVDDMDSTFVNGHFVGSSDNKYLPRRYRLPAGLLREGDNTILIRITDTEGNGGIAPGKQYRLTSGEQEIDLAGNWEYQTGYASPPLPSQGFTRVYYKPGSLYHSMLEPLTAYTIKGVAWYQGEANTGANKALEYRRLLPDMIGEWRAAWGQGNFPFLIVQLANHMQPRPAPSQSSWALLRESQAVVAATTPNCALAVAIDLGEANDIHPFRKKEVGKRLALQAESLTGNDIRTVSSGPVFRSMEVKDSTVVLSFTHTGSGLVAAGGVLKQFAIAGADKQFVWADAVILHNQVIVSAAGIKRPVAVRYAWADNPEGCNLQNREGLPAVPFRTDNW